MHGVNCMDDKRFNLKSRSARMTFALLAVALTVIAVVPYTAFKALKISVLGLLVLVRLIVVALVDSLIALVWYCHSALIVNWKE